MKFETGHILAVCNLQSVTSPKEEARKPRVLQRHNFKDLNQMLPVVKEIRVNTRIGYEQSK